MPASPMDQRLGSLSLCAESSDDRSQSPADEEYPHHEKFYFDDGSVTFVVDGTAYCLHRFLFSLHSDTFSKTFIAGHRDTKSPIFLQDIEKSQFDAFLNVLYRTSYTSGPTMTAAAWASVLHLASQWNFPSIRELAIQSFTPSASDVDKVVLGHRYRFEEWLLPGYTGLVERKEPLTLEEGMRLSVEDVISINKAREEIRAASSSVPMAKIEMSQDIHCQSCGYTNAYTFDSTQTKMKCQSTLKKSYSCNANIALPIITSNPSPPSALPSTDEISQKVKTLIPRSSLSR